MNFRSALSTLAAACVVTVSVSALSDTPDTVRIPRANVKFDAPAGWVKSTAGDWVRFRPTDEFARLGYVVFDRPHEATSRIGQIAEHFELSNLTWGGAEDTTVGPFPAHSATAASCTLRNGDPCHLWYATVNPGTPEQVLIVYLVNQAKGEKHRGAVKSAVQSMRRL